MKKKIYAVRKGRVPGIYDVWSETEQQVKGFKGAEYRSFTYMTEKESEDETVEMSRSYAMKQAVEYLERILDESDREEGVLEKYDETYFERRQRTSAEYKWELLYRPLFLHFALYGAALSYFRR